VGGEFPITVISGDSGPPIFPLEIDEHDQLGAKDTKRERSVTKALSEKLNTLFLRQDSWFPAR
jgi:hypothetical protein